MSRKRDKSDRWHQYIFDLGNPYATEQVEDVAASNTSDATVHSNSKSEPRARVESISSGHLTKGAFQRECRDIFRAYIPPPEKGRLRPHHRSFISRHEDRSAEERHSLVAELRKYDLRSMPEFKPQFNREDGPFTEAKLREIESAALPNLKNL